MAILFNDEPRVVPAWQSVCQYLSTQPRRETFNVLVEMETPCVVTNEDRQRIKAVDQMYRAVGKAQPVNTVMNTLFPQNMYLRFGRPLMYEKFMGVNQRTREGGASWGTYAQRMIQPYRDQELDESRNQLEILITKLSRVAAGGRIFAAAYELNVLGEPDSQASEEVAGGEVPLYLPSKDANQVMGMPCLSHLSFKVNRERELQLTAMYRAHYYGERALGNFLGLASLLKFVAHESGLETGTLTCLSTYARLDTEPFGGLRQANATISGPL